MRMNNARIGRDYRRREAGLLAIIVAILVISGSAFFLLPWGERDEDRILPTPTSTPERPTVAPPPTDTPRVTPTTTATTEPTSTSTPRPVPTSTQTVAPTPRPTPTLRPPPPSFDFWYLIEPGDTLWHLALELYGDPYMWEFLYENNPQLWEGGPDLIHVDNLLWIPTPGEGTWRGRAGG